MRLIQDPGLNCHLASILSIIASMGVHYLDAFATLWSETDFSYDKEYNAYASKRLYGNLQSMGVKIKNVSSSSPTIAKENFVQIPTGELFMVGMDTFDTPWSPVYQFVHGQHYFIAEKYKHDIVYCFDPIYHQKYIAIKSDWITMHCCKMTRIQKTATHSFAFAPKQEALCIIQSHPLLEHTIKDQLYACTNETPANIIIFSKKIDVLISNRHLFGQCLSQYLSAQCSDPPFFTSKFFSQWQAVKNGLIKASILKNRSALLLEVGDLIEQLLCQEILLAQQLLQSCNRP